MLRRNGKHVLQDREIILPLVLDVVDGKHRLDGAVTLVTVVKFCPQVDHRQGRLPVVGVEDVGVVIQARHHLQHGAAEEGIALGVVKVTVQGAALEVILVIHKVEGHAVLPVGEDTAVLVAPAELEREGSLGRHVVDDGGRDLVV